MAALNVGTVSIRIEALTTGFGRALRGVGGQLAALQKQATGIASSFRFIGGAVFLGGVFKGVQAISDFEASVSELRATFGLTIKDAATLESSVQGIAREARRVAVETQFTATEVIGAANAFARAGFSALASAENLAATANFAAAAGTEIGKAADIAIAAIVGFKLAPQEFEKAVDQLVVAALSANTTIEELGVALKFVAGPARVFGQEVSTVAALLGVFANAGLKGTLGGTALRQIFISLQKDADKVNSTLEKFGVTLFEVGQFNEDGTRKFRQLTEVLAELGRKTSGATDLIRVFQARALAGALSATALTSAEFAILTEKIEGELGAASRVATERLNNLRGELIRVKSAVEEFFISLGVEGGLIDSLRQGAISVKNFFLTLSQLNPELLKGIVSFTLATAKIGLAVAAIVALAGAVSFLLSPLGQLGSAFIAAFSGVDLINQIRPQLEKLKPVFFTGGKLLGIKLLRGVISGIAGLSRLVGEELGKISGESLAELAGPLSGLAPIFRALGSAPRQLFSVFELFGDLLDRVSGRLGETEKKLREEFRPALAGILDQAKLLGRDLRGIADAANVAVSALGPFEKQIASARAIERALAADVQESIAPLSEAEKVFRKLSEVLAFPPSDATPELLQEVAKSLLQIGEQTAKLEEAKRIIEEFGTPAEISADALDLVGSALDDLSESKLGRFRFETELGVMELEKLQGALIELKEFGRAGELDALIDQFKKVRKELDELVKVEIGREFARGFDQLLDATIRGTDDTISAFEIFKEAAIREFENLFSKAISEKLKFDAIFEDNLFGLGDVAKKALGRVGEAISGVFQTEGGGAAGGFLSRLGGFVGGLFRGDAAGGAGLAPAVPEGFVGPIQQLGTGGIALRPTLAVVGDVAEAIVPLDRMDEVMGRGRPITLVQNISTPDARSFLRSKTQVAAAGRRLLDSASRRNN